MMIKDANFSVDVLSVEENEDGSATLTVDMSPVAAQYFIERGLVTVLMDAVKNLEKPETD
jgi:hypothetical protein